MGDRAGALHIPSPGDIVAGENSIVEEPVVAEPEPLRNQRNYRISDEDRVGAGSLKKKCRYNLAAIELLKKLEAEARQPTEAEKRVLVRYVGWGGLPQVFDSWNEEWQGEGERLAQLLTPEELESARATTLNAHYTAPAIIRAIYAALQRLGFAQGRILEPACGLGHFIGLMPAEMQSRSHITGVEIDSVTARLACLLYPDADIRHQPFEDSRLADDFYDVAISNIPFGDYKPFDARFKQWNFLIHDYFFAAALAKVRPGGLVLFITSKGTFDKLDGSLREYVSHQADLLGAIRLPNDAFKKNANTEVTTDIVILRKRLPGELPSGPAWKGVGEMTNSLGETIPVNEYFAAHPEMMLGEMRLEGRMYARPDPTLVGNGVPLVERLAEAIALLPRDVYQPPRSAVRRATSEQLFPAPEHVKPNAYALVNEQVAIRDGDQLRLVEGLPSQRLARIRGLIRVRDAVRRCLRSQLEATDETEVETARLQLNQTYDRFVARQGPISERANTSAFRGDPDLPLLLSLEHYDEETRRATKAAIFRERTVQRGRRSIEIKTPQDGLLVTLGERGTVDLDYLATLLHRNGALTLLVINKDPANSRTGQVTLQNFAPRGDVVVRSYGIPQDEAARTGLGLSNIVGTAFTGIGSSFTSSFAPYSMSVLTLQPSTTPNAAPTVAMTAPQNNTALATDQITLGAVANDADGLVTRVEFVANGHLIATATKEPFTLTWSNVVPGAYTLSARATDHLGLMTTSAPVVIGVSTAPITLIPKGATWRYLDTGANLGTVWRGNGFVDTAWPAGPAQLGFGDGDEATLVASNRQWTTYFRRTFVVPPNQIATNLLLRVLRDDGAVVYLNSNEVWRSNLPATGTIAYNTPALTSVPAGDETTNFHTTNVSVTLWGTNILAVEVHQNQTTSSDLSFDCELLAFVTSPPTLRIWQDGSAVALGWPTWATGAVAESSVSLAGSWTTVTNTVAITNQERRLILQSPTNGTRAFRLRFPGR